MAGGGLSVSDAQTEAGMCLNFWTVEIGFEWEVEWHWEDSMLEFKHSNTHTHFSRREEWREAGYLYPMLKQKQVCI
jgi:hypothetical protein